MKYFLFIIFFLLFSCYIRAQQDSGGILKNDSNGQTHKKNNFKKTAININEQNPLSNEDSLIQDSVSSVKTLSVNIDSLRKDSLIKAQTIARLKNYDSVLASIGLPVFAKPVYMLTPERFPEEKNGLFYTLAGIVFLLALVKTIFPSYIQNMYNLFFQKSGADVNTRYAAQQNSVAFFLMQLVFICSGGIYITLLSEKYLHFQYTFGEKLLFSAISLAGIYVVKDILIRFLGWVFNLQSEAKVYLLYVFLVNMVLAIVLLPVISVLAFSESRISSFFLVASFILLVIFFVYRYFLTIKMVQTRLHAKTIQIFLYLCVVEILPIVLLYKLLLNYTNGMN